MPDMQTHCYTVFKETNILITTKGEELHGKPRFQFVWGS